MLNYDDKVLREFGEKKDLKPKVIFFSSTQTLKEGMYLDGDMMLYAHDGKKEEVLNVKCAGLPKSARGKVTWDNFSFGSVFDGKLVPKVVSGGVVLREVTFEIKKPKNLDIAYNL